MKNMFTKKNIMPVAVLVVICVVTAALIGVINSFTSAEIERQRLEAANAGKIEVLPTLDVTTAEEISVDPAKYPKEVKAITKFDAGYVIETSVKGNAPGMRVLVGFDNSGAITGVKVLENGETPTYWANVVNVVTGKDGKYNGKTPETLKPELVSGATNSSTGVFNAVKASADAFVVANGGEVELETYEPPVSLREDSELIALAGELVQDSAGFVAVDFDAESYDAKYLARLFKENGSKGYVAYVVVMSTSYEGQIESETLIHIDNNRKIKKINKLACNISPSNPEYNYTAPTEDEVNAFYDRLPNNNSQTIGNVELVTNATNTTTRVRDSVAEALVVVTDLIIKHMPTPEEQVLAFAEEMVGDGSEFTNITPEKRDFVKRIYRENTGRGYIAYLAAISPNYGTIETETLIYVGPDGRIKDIKKIIWKPSDPNPQYNYYPPAEEVVDAFYESLKGKNIAELEELKALADDYKNTPHGGLLATHATQTCGRLLGSLIEGVGVINEVRSKDMPRPEQEVTSLAQQMAGEGKTLTNVTPGNVEFLKRLYRIDNTNNYIAYIVVPLVNQYYNKVETETMIYITDEGTIGDIKKITWKPSDPNPQYNYYPPAEEVVDAFYESLKGKEISELEEFKTLADDYKNTPHEGLLITQATETTGRLLGGLIEALESSEAINLALDTATDNTPRIVGIVLIAALVVSAPAIVIIKRRKNS